MRQAYFRDAGAKYNDIIYFSKPADWKFQIHHAQCLYPLRLFQLQPEGWARGAGIPGPHRGRAVWDFARCLANPLVDVGPNGEDEGKGGKYLLLPRDFKGEAPAGYIPVRAATYNGYALFRAIPAPQSEVDVAKAIALVKQLRLYPLAKASHAGFVKALLEGSEPWWPGVQWGLADTLGFATKTGFSFQTADYLDIDARAPIYFLAYAVPAKLGEASFYLVSYKDDAG